MDRTFSLHSSLQLQFPLCLKYLPPFSSQVCRSSTFLRLTYHPSSVFFLQSRPFLLFHTVHESPSVLLPLTFSSLSHLAPLFTAPSYSDVVHKRAREIGNEKDEQERDANNSNSQPNLRRRALLAPTRSSLPLQTFDIVHDSSSSHFPPVLTTLSPSCPKGRRILWDAEYFPSSSAISPG